MEAAALRHLLLRFLGFLRLLFRFFAPLPRRRIVIVVHEDNCARSGPVATGRNHDHAPASPTGKARAAGIAAPRKAAAGIARTIATRHTTAGREATASE